MATTVKVVCYKSKTLSNGESPLMLRVTKDRKLKYVSLGISVNPQDWDFKHHQPKQDCPNYEYIEILIADKLKAYNSKIIELKVTNQEFTSSSLVDKVLPNVILMLGLIKTLYIYSNIRIFWAFTLYRVYSKNLPFYLYSRFWEISIYYRFRSKTETVTLKKDTVV